MGGGGVVSGECAGGGLRQRGVAMSRGVVVAEVGEAGTSFTAVGAGSKDLRASGVVARARTALQVALDAA